MDKEGTKLPPIRGAQAQAQAAFAARAESQQQGQQRSKTGRTLPQTPDVRPKTAAATPPSIASRPKTPAVRAGARVVLPPLDASQVSAKAVQLFSDIADDAQRQENVLEEQRKEQAARFQQAKEVRMRALLARQAKLSAAPELEVQSSSDDGDSDDDVSEIGDAAALVAQGATTSSVTTAAQGDLVEPAAPIMQVAPVEPTVAIAQAAPAAPAALAAAQPLPQKKSLAEKITELLGRVDKINLRALQENLLDLVKYNCGVDFHPKENAYLIYDKNGENPIYFNGQNFYQQVFQKSVYSSSSEQKPISNLYKKEFLSEEFFLSEIKQRLKDVLKLQQQGVTRFLKGGYEHFRSSEFCSHDVGKFFAISEKTKDVDVANIMRELEGNAADNDEQYNFNPNNGPHCDDVRRKIFGFSGAAMSSVCVVQSEKQPDPDIIWSSVGECILCVEFRALDGQIKTLVFANQDTNLRETIGYKETRSGKKDAHITKRQFTFSSASQILEMFGEAGAEIVAIAVSSDGILGDEYKRSRSRQIGGCEARVMNSPILRQDIDGVALYPNFARDEDDKLLLHVDLAQNKNSFFAAVFDGSGERGDRAASVLAANVEMVFERVGLKTKEVVRAESPSAAPHGVRGGAAVGGFGQFRV